MKLFIITNQHVGHGDWHQILIRAENEEQVRSMAASYVHGCPLEPVEMSENNWFRSAQVEEVSVEGPTQVLLSAYAD